MTMPLMVMSWSMSVGGERLVCLPATPISPARSGPATRQQNFTWGRGAGYNWGSQNVLWLSMSSWVGTLKTGQGCPSFQSQYFLFQACSPKGISTDQKFDEFV
jgi:hypothetical protein